MSVALLHGKALTAVLVLAVGLTSAGCWDNRDPRNRAFVTAIGFDLTDDQLLEVTFQIPATGQLRGAAGGGKGKQGQVAFTTVTGRAGNFSEAYTQAQAGVSRDLYLGQTNLLVFGRRLVEKGVRPLVLELARSPEMVTCFFAMADQAREALAVKPPLETIPGVYIRSFFESVEVNGRFLQTRMWKLYRDLLTPGKDALMPVMQMAGAEFSITGTAVLKDDRLAAILNDQETRGLVWLLKPVKGEALTVKVGEHAYPLRYIKSKTKTKVYWSGNRPVARAYIQVSGELAGQWSEVDSHTLERVEAALNKHVQDEVRTVLTRVREVDSDPVGFGARLLDADPTRWRNANWDKEYPQVQVDLSVRSHIFGTGMRK